MKVVFLATLISTALGAAPSGKYEGSVPFIIDITLDIASSSVADLDINIKVAHQEVKCPTETIAISGTSITFPNSANTGDCMGDGVRTQKKDASKYFLDVNSDGSLTFHSDGYPDMKLTKKSLAVVGADEKACTWHGLPYDEPACDMFHNNTATKESLLAAIQLRADSNPGTCVACILAGVWGSLTAENLGAVNAACNLCSCQNLDEATCTTDIKAVLYGIIALLPASALGIFEACKTQCVNMDNFPANLLV